MLLLFLGIVFIPIELIMRHAFFRIICYRLLPFRSVREANFMGRGESLRPAKIPLRSNAVSELVVESLETTKKKKWNMAPLGWYRNEDMKRCLNGPFQMVILFGRSLGLMCICNKPFTLLLNWCSYEFFLWPPIHSSPFANEGHDCRSKVKESVVRWLSQWGRSQESLGIKMGNNDVDESVVEENASSETIECALRNENGSRVLYVRRVNRDSDCHTQRSRQRVLIPCQTFP